MEGGGRSTGGWWWDGISELRFAHNFNRIPSTFSLFLFTCCCCCFIIVVVVAAVTVIVVVSDGHIDIVVLFYPFNSYVFG